jgi:site-specific DNA-methyltransferase (adenine-specific)
MMARSFHVAQKDAVEWLRTIGDQSVDLVVTDPPYESLEKHRAIGTTTRLKNDWFQIFPNARFRELFLEAYRVLKKNAHFYLFCDQETMFYVKPIAEECGFKFWKPLIWRKDTIGMGYHYRSLYEVILFFEKGKRKLADLGIPDVLDAPRVRNGYPAEKPIQLAKLLVSQSSAPGEVVADPFMGSGTFGVGALEQDRIFWGTDICGEAVGITTSRLLEVGGVAGQLTGSRTGPDAVGGQLSIGLY